MTDGNLLQSIEALAIAATTVGMLPQPFGQLYDEVNRLINERNEATEEREHYRLLYQSVCSQYGAYEELPPL